MVRSVSPAAGAPVSPGGTQQEGTTMARSLLRAILPGVGAGLAAAFASMGGIAGPVYGYDPGTGAQDRPAQAPREGDGGGHD